MSSYKILLLSPALEEVGGVSVFAQTLIEFLNPEFVVDHFQIGNRPGNRNPFKQIFFFLHDGKELKKRLKEKAYDVVHLNPSFRILSLLRDSYYLSRINKQTAGKALVLFHGWDEFLAARIQKNILLRRLFRCIYGKARLLTVLCRSFKDSLVKMGIPAEMISVVTTMYREGHIPAKDSKHADRDSVQVLFMGRLFKSKGPYVAAEAAKILLENGNRVRFVLAGEGPEYVGLQKYIQDHGLAEYVSLPGNIVGEEKKNILRSSDIFVLPSVGEGCPIALLEAMGSGLAVVSTPVGAVPDIIEQEKNGLLVKTCSGKSFSQAVLRLIKDKNLLRRMQSLNRKEAKQSYSAEVVTRKIESLYSSIIHDK